MKHNILSKIINYSLVLILSVGLNYMTTGCSEERYFPGKIYTDEDLNDDNDDDVTEKVNENLAIEGSITASSKQDDAHGPELLINGVVSGGEEYFGTNQTTSDHEEWVQIKLSQKQKINAIWIHPRSNSDIGFPFDFTLQVSENGKDWTTVVEETNYDADYTKIQKFSFEAIKASYVKLIATKLSHTSNMWTNWQEVYFIQLAEIEVYLVEGDGPSDGDDDDEGEVEQQNPNPANFAFGASVTASSQQGDTFIPSMLVNGVLTGENEYYGSFQQTFDHEEWVQLVMKEQAEIGSIWVYPRSNASGEGFPKEFKIEISTNGENWTTVVDKTDYPVPTECDVQIFNFTPTNVKYIKLTATKLSSIANMWTNWEEVYFMQLAEIQAFKDQVSGENK